MIVPGSMLMRVEKDVLASLHMLVASLRISFFDWFFWCIFDAKRNRSFLAIIHILKGCQTFFGTQVAGWKHPVFCIERRGNYNAVIPKGLKPKTYAIENGNYTFDATWSKLPSLTSFSINAHVIAVNMRVDNVTHCIGAPILSFLFSIKRTVEKIHDLDMVSCRLIDMYVLNLKLRNICVYLTYFGRLMLSVLCA